MYNLYNCPLVFFSLTRILLFVECFFLHVHGRQAIYCRDMLGHYIARMLDLFYLFRFRDTTTRNIQKPICYVHVDVFHHVAIAAFHCLAEFQQEPACCLFSMRCKTPCFGYVFDCFCMYCVCVLCEMLRMWAVVWKLFICDVFGFDVIFLKLSETT